MDLPGTSGENNVKRNYRFAEVAGKYIARTDIGGKCVIDPESGCPYTQHTKLDVQNFIRHFRTIHPKKAKELGLLLEQEPLAKKKPRVVPKRPVPIDEQVLVEGTTKLVAYHNLPVSCVEWEGMKILLDPIIIIDGNVLMRVF